MTTPSFSLSKDTALKLSAGLGWFSLGLGAAQLAVPGKVNALIGVRDTGRNRLLQRLFGAQELGMGMGIFAVPRRDMPIWSRVAGDAVHISLMAATLSSKHTNRTRATATLAALGSVAALDALTAASLRATAPSGKYAQHTTYATTINRPVSEVYGFWRDFANLPSFMRHLESVEVLSDTRSRWTATAPAGKTVSWDAEIVEDEPNAKIAWRSTGDADVANAGHVRFRPAPADQGTEVSVTINYSPPFGPIGTGVAMLAREDPRQQIQEDLLRLKQVLEVGEVVVSSGTIDGATLHQHPAQPAERRPAAGSAIRPFQRSRVPLSGARVKGDPRMKATCWMGTNNVQVMDVPDPQILNARDAIVRVTSTAICGSDLHLVDGYIPSMQRGDILGHEFMGEVVEVGREVNNLKVGDRVVVPFPIACGVCNACNRGLYSICENANPNAWMSEKLYGHPIGGIFGYSHLTGGYAGGQAEFVRVPFADVGPLKVPEGMDDEQALFLSDILPTGYMGAEMCDIKPGDVVAVWGAGPVGQFAIVSAFLLGAERVIAIDRFPYRLDMARDKAGAETINYEHVNVLEALKEMTGGRGPDACIDAVGMEAHGHGLVYAYDRVKQLGRMQFDRPIALREAIMACRSGGVVSVIGVYGSFIDKFPMGSAMNRSLTIRGGQAHVHRYMQPLLEHIERGDIDPTFVITHRLSLDEAPKGYELFKHKRDNCEKVILRAS